MMFEPIEEMLSFWHWWEKCKRGNNRDERREEQLEEEDPEEENIEREK